MRGKCEECKSYAERDHLIAICPVPFQQPNDWHFPEITLNEGEISDVSLGTFYVFDKENAGGHRLRERPEPCSRCSCSGCGQQMLLHLYRA
jgi:hypothetical protein